VRRHTVAKVLSSSLLALALVTGVGVTWIYSHLDGNISRVNLDDELGDDRPVDPGPQGALNILVLGSDTREGAGNGVDGEGGGGSDTTILMHLSADRRSAYGISIPRDSIVDRPECTTASGAVIPAADDVMWNAAFNEGGPGCTIRQFEQTTGVRVDDYVVVDFRGFKSMVDAVGGVEICTPEPIDDPKTGFTLPAGTQTIKGDDALNYVRSRYNIGDGSDLGRVKRQQAFIASMAAKVVSGDTLARPDRILGFLNAATKSLQTDIESLFDLAKVGSQFNGVGLQRIQFVTVPNAYADADGPFAGRVFWTDDAPELWTKVANDAPLGRLRAEAITAADQPTASASADPSDEPSDDPSDEATDEPTDEPSATDEPTDGPSDGASTGAEDEAGLDAEARAAVGLCS
jgi:LCP family protein required for cell wall assembly